MRPPSQTPAAEASSLLILFWDSDVHSFLRIPQVAQTEWLPVSPKSSGIWPQTKFAWGQGSASPQPRLAAGEERLNCVLWLREESFRLEFLMSSLLKNSGVNLTFLGGQKLHSYFPWSRSMVLSGPHHLEQTQIPGFFPTALLWVDLTLPHSNKT